MAQRAVSGLELTVLIREPGQMMRVQNILALGRTLITLIVDSGFQLKKII
jgi:hypothetical protein